MADVGGREISRDYFGIMYLTILDDPDKYDPTHVIVVKMVDSDKNPKYLVTCFENGNPRTARELVRNLDRKSYARILKKRLARGRFRYEQSSIAGRHEEFADRWIKIGLTCEPADRAKAEEGIRAAYRAAYQNPPEKIVWCGSPASAFYSSCIPNNRRMQGLEENFWLRHLSPSIQCYILETRGRTDSKFRGEHLCRVINDNLIEVVRGSAYDRFDTKSALFFDEKVRSLLAQRLTGILRGLETEIRTPDAFKGQHEVEWLAYFDYIRQVFHLEEDTHRLDGLNTIAQNAGWIFPYENICWVTERPTALHQDDQGRLHSLNGPAVSYPDGWNVYAIHGVNVPYHVFEAPDKITAEEIDQIDNAEVRRVMVDRYGQARYLRDTGAVEISKDAYGVLYRREIPGLEPLVTVKVINSTREADGSAKEYFLRVPPAMTTAREAVAWTFGIPPENYDLQQES